MLIWKYFTIKLICLVKKNFFENQRHREREIASVSSLLKMAATVRGKPGRSQTFHLGLPRGEKGPGSWAISCCLVGEGTYPSQFKLLKYTFSSFISSNKYASEV